MKLNTNTVDKANRGVPNFDAAECLESREGSKIGSTRVFFELRVRLRYDS